MHCAAYKALPTIAKLAIFHLDLHYWESGRANPIEISQRWLAEVLDCDPKTAAKVLTSLDDYGFLELEQRGKMKGPTNARAAVYRITWHPDNEGQPATFNYRKWQPPIPERNAGNTTAFTRDYLVSSAGRSGSQRGNFRGVGDSLPKILDRLKAQRNGVAGEGKSR